MTSYNRIPITLTYQLSIKLPVHYAVHTKFGGWKYRCFPWNVCRVGPAYAVNVVNINWTDGMKGLTNVLRSKRSKSVVRLLTTTDKCYVGRIHASEDSPGGASASSTVFGPKIINNACFMHASTWNILCIYPLAGSGHAVNPRNMEEWK